jgi:hypothetical protein
MLRVRFRTTADDPRSVNWPIKHPYWITGYTTDDFHAIIVAYADDEAYILSNWPEAYNLESEEVEGYHFTDRFPKPEWFNTGFLRSEQVMLAYLHFYRSGLDTAGEGAYQDFLEDMVNQNCTAEMRAGRNIIQDMGLSAHEGAIAHLVSIGRLVRLPGMIERYVWVNQAISGVTTPAVTGDIAVCPHCFEAAEGPHWRECQSIAISEGRVK